MGLQGFDRSFYLEAKLSALKAEDGSWADRDTADLETLFQEYGLTPESHYSRYGYLEGLNPNPYFNHGEYRLAKAADMVEKGRSSSLDTALIFLDSVWQGDLYQHYLRFGAAEGINPSNAFDETAYLAGKLTALRIENTVQWTGKTIDDLRMVIKNAGMTVIDHYIRFGAKEGLTVTRVPPDERVGEAILPHAGVRIPDTLSLDWVDYSEIASAPHRAIGQVKTVSGNTASIGTGFMITPEHVLTNAHAVLDTSGHLDPAAAISFAPGLNGDSTAARTYDWERVWAQHTFGDDLYPSWPDNDLAVIKLATPLNTGFLSLENQVNLSLINTPLYSAGYSSKDIEQDNPQTPGQDYYQWEVAGTVDRYIQGNGALDLSSDMTVSAGASGSPLYYAGDGTWYFTGVLSGISGNDTVAAAIDTDSYNWILGILQQDGYYPDYTPV